MRRLLFKALVIGAAIAAALVPWPAPLVERIYSTGLYPPLQRVLTSAANLTAIAIFDVALGLALAALLVLVVRRGRVMNVLTLLACVWLAFLLTWGLNYRRVPLAERLARVPESAAPAERADALLAAAVRELNGLARGAHAQPWPSFAEWSPRMTGAFEQVQQRLGLPGGAIPARPKTSALTPFFRLAAVDGFTNPFLLETIVNPGVLPAERPHVLAHEWAHLAGLAGESEASFFAWLACLRAGDQARYSGWLGVIGRLTAIVPPARARALIGQLAEEPRADLRAIRARLGQASPVVRQVTETTYDKYLRANRVELGIASYDAVVNLMVSAALVDEFVPLGRVSGVPSRPEPAAEPTRRP